VEHKLCAVRSFLRFAGNDGLVDGTVLEAVPAAKSPKQARIPSVWDPADVAKILEAVDRGSPCGKRDYAIILLITRLGLRGVDVKRLRFGDLDWPGNRLSVVQAKTGHRVQLPLPIPAPPRASVVALPEVPATACAYVMFTSGSTGRPKPVAIPHRGVVRLAVSDAVAQRPRSGDRVLHAYGLSSDASTIEIWSSLLGGACLVLVEREELLSPTVLESRLRAERVTIAYLTTGVFHHVARTRPQALRTLRFVSAVASHGRCKRGRT
jgi:non-ribosomal peptide synthetase component F